MIQVGQDKILNVPDLELEIAQIDAHGWRFTWIVFQQHKRFPEDHDVTQIPASASEIITKHSLIHDYLHLSDQNANRIPMNSIYCFFVLIL